MSTAKKTTTTRAKKTAKAKKGGRAAASNAPTSTTAASPSPTEDILVAGSQTAYEQYLPAAKALTAKEVIPFRADIALALRNVNEAMDTIGGPAIPALFASKVPQEDLPSFRALPAMCQAVAFASHAVSPSRSRQLRPKMSEGIVLRAKLFRAADSLVDGNVFPAQRVADLHAGKGPIDAANDLTGLASLFNEFKVQTRGKTTVTAAMVARAYALGAELTAALQPHTAKPTRPKEVKAAADARDRLWTLLVQKYTKLGDVCAYLFGREDLDVLVPPLLSHAATTSKRIKANALKRAAAKGAKGSGDGSGTGTGTAK